MILLFLLNVALAQNIQIVTPCSNELLYSHLATNGANLGEITLQALIQSGLQFQGTEQGINQINYSPTGSAAIDFISNSEMLSYGWCYSLNGVVPEIYPHEIFLNAGDQVVWFYGFAHYKNGEWISQCEDSALRAQSPFCKKISY